MNAKNESLQELQHIKKMMERSTKFSSLSGLSGIAAGICALVGVWFAVRSIADWKSSHANNPGLHGGASYSIAINCCCNLYCGSYIRLSFFIYLRCKKLGIPVLGMSARRVIVNMAIPLFMGSLFILRLATAGAIT